MAAPKVGGGGRIVSRARVPGGNKKLLSVVRERERVWGLKFLAMGT
jgi:hypothetical protein